MTVNKMTEIIKQVDENKIAESMKDLGYIDCETDKSLHDINFLLLADGKIAQTKFFGEKSADLEYCGEIITDVKGWEKYEFVVININKHQNKEDFRFPIRILTFAKPISTN
jgi:hypothetical protein